MKLLALFVTFLVPTVVFAQGTPTKKAASSPALLSTWKVDTSHTSVSFRVKHLGISSVRGSFSDVQGEVTTDENDLTQTKVSVEIGTASVNTGVERRDNHLKSPDFFDAANFPKMKFVSTKVYKGPTGAWLVDGTMTIKSTTKPVTLTLEGPTPPIGVASGKARTGFSATTSIDRKDFGLVWNNVVEGVNVVGDKIEIFVESELIRTTANKT